MRAPSASEVLDCVRRHRERYDFEISAEMSTPLDTVRRLGAELVSARSVIACMVTRYADGDPTDAWLYRIAGFTPPPAPGRKARAPS
jgi:transcription initiation factor IIE alpha subunit